MKLFHSKKFWIAFILLGLIAAITARFIGIQSENEVRNAKLMYVCDENPLKQYYLTIPQNYTSTDLLNYMQVVNQIKNNIDFEHGSISKNRNVYVTGFLEDSTIARVIIVNKKPTYRQPYREVHYIWVGFLRKSPCD
jgi:hypothetical protein